MAAITTFDSTKESLLDMLRSIADSKTQLPDFQRGWVWDDDHIRSLLASLSLSYPVGTVMMLETGGEEVRFKPRLVEGVVANGVKPERLILDGQQRLTSLYLATLYGGRGNARCRARSRSSAGTTSRWLRHSTPNGDRDEAIVSLPEDRLVRNFRNEVIADYSTPEREYETGLFPFESGVPVQGMAARLQRYWEHDGDKVGAIRRFRREVIKRFEQYQMPLITLRRPTPKEAVCQVFEKVNTGGVSLTVFELMTATFAADDYNLREDWSIARPIAGIQSAEEDPERRTAPGHRTARDRHRRKAKIAEGVTPDNAPGIGCKRKDILALTLAEYCAGQSRQRKASSVCQAAAQPEDLRRPRSSLRHAVGAIGCDHGDAGRTVRARWCALTTAAMVLVRRLWRVVRQRRRKPFCPRPAGSACLDRRWPRTHHHP